MKRKGLSFDGKKISIFTNNSTGTKQDNKVDPQIMARCTELAKIKKAFSTATKGGGFLTSNRNQDNNSKPPISTRKANNIYDWRKKQTNGDVWNRNGVDWYWCPHHYWEGEFDRLYCTHRPEDHRGRCPQRDRNGANGTGPTGNNGDKNSTKLVLSDKLKQALMSEYDFSDQQMAQIQAAADASNQRAQTV